MDLSALNFAKRLIQLEKQRLLFDFKNKEEWEKYRTGLVQYLQDAIMFRKTDHKESIKHGIFELDDIFIEYTDVYFDKNFYIPVLIYSADINAESYKILIYMPDSGKRKNDPDVTKSAIDLVKEGFTVIVPDPAAQGETADRPDYSTDINNINALSKLLGTNLISLECMRLDAIVKYVHDLTAGKKILLSICSEGDNGLTCLIYTLFNERISSCKVIDGMFSISDIAESMPVYRRPLYLPEGLYRHGDICHVAAAVAPRKLSFQCHVTEESLRFERFMKSIYRLYDADEYLEFDWR